MTQRLIESYEEVSSFLHSEKVWMAILECGHEVRLGEKPELGKKYIECEECDAETQDSTPQQDS